MATDGRATVSADEELGIDRLAGVHVRRWPVLERKARDDAAPIAREVWRANGQTLRR